MEVKDAEIERMQREQIKLFSAYDALEQKLIGAKAEIEWLKEEISALNNQIMEMELDKDLLTRAADALKRYAVVTETNLIHELREAAE